MTPSVELIYDPDCPHVAQARTALRDAFTQAGQAAAWTEWDRHDAASPSYAQGFGSPTVLVNGRDVVGVPEGAMPACCRVYAASGGGLTGAPTAETILEALVGSSTPPSRTGRRAPLSGVGATFALAGLCPVCWTAYAGLLGSLGIGFLLNTAVLLPVTLLLLAVALFAMGYRACDRRGYGPLKIGIVAGVLILFARFTLVSDPLTFLGLAVLVAASIWNVWPVAREVNPCSVGGTEGGPS